jgi:beta-phosphoglucomutase
MYKGVIFDFNGTLFWDTDLHNQAWDIYLDQYNIRLTEKEKHEKLHGKNNAQLIRELIDANLADEKIEKIARDKELIYQEIAKKENLQLAEGVIPFFEFLKGRKIPFTIVTASDKLNVDFFWEHLHLQNWFDYNKIIFADGSIKPKPFPDMYLKAMEILKLKPSETIIFEDSETGLQSAKNAKPGKLIIVDSNGADYSNWDEEIIRSFNDFDKSVLG